MKPEFKITLLQLLDKTKGIEQLEQHLEDTQNKIAAAREHSLELSALLYELEPDLNSPVYGKVYPIQKGQVVKLSQAGRRVFFYTAQIGESL